MAILSQDQIQDILEKKTPDYEIHRARRYHDHLVFHTERVLSYYNSKNVFKNTSNTYTSPRYPELRHFKYFREQYPLALLPQDKVTTFDSLFSLPVATVPVTDKAMKELSRVFYAPDRYISFNFEDKDLEDDFKDYLYKIKDDDFWKHRGIELLRSAINSVFVVDLPKLETDENGTFISATKRPEPYYTHYDIYHIIDIEVDYVNNTKWVLLDLKGDRKNLALIDGGYYRIYSKLDESRGGEQGYTLTYESEHGLGYCPARQFWTDNVVGSRIIKDGPLTPVLGNLDWMLYTITSKKHLDLYSGFPIMSMYESKCDYIDEDGFSCNNGKIVKTIEKQGAEQIIHEPCPQCSNRKMAGPGTVLLAPVRADSDDPDMLKSIYVQEGDVASLQHMEQMIQDMEDQFMEITTGIITEDPGREQAKNEFQIARKYESRQNILLRVKNNFENIHKFLLDTIGRLRYGNEYLGCTVDWGDEFFLKSEVEMQEEYQEAKKAGVPMAELQNKRKLLYKKQYANNMDIKDKLEILGEIEPYPDMSIEELIKTKRDAPMSIDMELFTFKLNFNTFVERFEREFAPISDFLTAADHRTRVETIRNVLLDYNAEQYEKQRQQAQEEFEKAQGMIQQNQQQNEEEDGV